MNSVEPNPIPTPKPIAGINFPAASLQRAARALHCSPFTRSLLDDMARQGVALRAIAGTEGVARGYLRAALGLTPVENALLWLVEVGVLRREVDGQGITDSFRLTPMGHELLARTPVEGFPMPSWGDRLQNRLAQWQPNRFF